MIVENGITYNVYADAQGRDRPWILDPLPYLLTADEWRNIEAGVAQRARLLNAVLIDLYGKQELLSQGALPAEVPFGHPNFLWPCTGIRPPGDRWLSIYAADLARSADGRWWVLADRTQTPSGAGYALENRQIVRRAFPELTQSMDVRSLSTFFAALRDDLLRGAEAEPLAVVLTPGSFNETYFEHAYLARQLGFPLVEGHDLTVRGEYVFLKTLAGLKRVHAIMRRLDDDFCDPVELRADSALGVPGLLGAIRKGNVAVANALGSGVLESAAWLGFLPAVAEQLIGERLSLPSVASWWCGEAPAFEAVIANLATSGDQTGVSESKPGRVVRSRLEHRRARDADRAHSRATARLRRPGTPGIFASPGLVHQELRRVLGTRTRHPRICHRDTAGLSGDARRACALRLLRACGNRLDAARRRQQGRVGVERSRAACRGIGRAVARIDPRAVARHQDLPSTLVENLFWMGRYAERCEDKTRLLRATLGLRHNLPFWPHAMEICKEFGASTVFDAEKRFSLSGDIGRLGECAAQARSNLSAENWRALTVLQREFRRDEAARRDARETLDRLLLSLVALAGFALDDMTQDDGWRLMMIGRRLERLQFLSRRDCAPVGRRGTAVARRARMAARNRRQRHYLSNTLSCRAGVGVTPSTSWSTMSAIPARSPFSGRRSTHCCSKWPSPSVRGRKRPSMNRSGSSSRCKLRT